MFYAASQIVFLLLVAAAIGGGIGYGIAQARHVNMSKALDRSGANKAMERDLANANSQIAELSKELDIANETIRRIDERRRQEQVEHDRRTSAAEMEDAATVEVEDAAVSEPDDDVPTPEMDEDWPLDEDEGDESYEDDHDDVDDDEADTDGDDQPVPVVAAPAGRDVDLETFEPVPEPEEADEFAWTAPVVASQRGSKGGRRLSERVADASTGNGSSAPYDVD